MDTDSFSVYIKIDNIYKNIVEVVEIRFDTWKDLHQKDRKIGHWLNKEQIRWKNYEKIRRLGAKTWADAFFWLLLGDKTLYGFLVILGCLLSKKVWWAVQIGSFCPNLRYFRDHNGPKKEPDEN